MDLTGHGRVRAADRKLPRRRPAGRGPAGRKVWAGWPSWRDYRRVRDRDLPLSTEVELFNVNFLAQY